MFKKIKTVIQIILVWSPVLYWNFNADTLTRTEILEVFVVGGAIAVMTELIYRFTSRIK